jgi:3-hydroxybutyryl-CoA dehydrogenase
MTNVATRQSSAMAANSEAIDLVGVVGGGLMGSGIAETVARSGYLVKVYEPIVESRDVSRARIDKSIARAESSGRISADERVAAMGRLRYVADLDELSDSDLVIEAVVEDRDIKLGYFKRLNRYVREDALLASNTSSIPIAGLASVVNRPERVLGMHFFSPVPVMGLVEVVSALPTGEDTIERATEFVKTLGKTPISTKDRSGFIVNMLLIPYLMAAVKMLEEGFATREDIDAGMKLGCGHPMGPLALCDLIGLDVLYAICDSLYEEFKRPEYAPPPLIKRMLATGWLGRKSGRGFYEYD